MFKVRHSHFCSPSNIAPTKTSMKQPYLVLAIDVGSSSIRCTAYEVNSVEDCDPFHVVAASSVPRRVIQPLTGRILVFSDGEENGNLFDVIDHCVDEVLYQLKSYSGKVVAIGFSTLVMNLIGVDEHCRPVGNDATLSYACQIPAVNEEVEHLKWYDVVSLR
jgi:gluconokinase